MNRRIASVALALASLWASSLALAETYPDKPVRIVVPYAPGGPTDVVARGLANRLGDLWKVPVVVDNKPGANEIIGASEVTRAKGDGYTLLMATDPTLFHNQYLYERMPYDVDKSFAPVTRLAIGNLALFVPKSFPADSLEQFVQYAKKNPDKISYGSTSPGNVTHLAMAWFANKTGAQMMHVPYKGLAPVIQDVLAGHIQAAFGGVSAIEQFAAKGDIKVLAVSGEQRVKVLPNVPTFKEAGYPSIDANFTLGLLAPQSTPAAVLNKIARDVKTVLAESAFREKYIEGFGFEVIGDDPVTFASYLIRDRERQKERVALSGAKLN